MNDLTNKGSNAVRIALPILLLVPLAVLLYRYRLIDFPFVLVLLALSFFGSLALFACCGIALINPNKNCPFNANMKKTLFLSAIVPVTLILTGCYFATMVSAPVIHDITTDTVDVPKFRAAIELRGSDSNSLTVKPSVIAEQVGAYPSIQTITSSLEPAKALALAVATAEQLGWTVHFIDRENGMIEAYETTKLWRFVDDVVIRVKAVGELTHVDLRSVSRVGSGDLGANAKRIQRFTELFSQQSQR